MYLYLHQKNSDSSEKTELEAGITPVCFSDRMVRIALADFIRKKQILITPDELRQIKIFREEKGKPHFLFPSLISSSGKEAIHYSVSHSGDWWGCLMAEEPVGFDMEVLRDRIHYRKIAKRFFTIEEYEYVLQSGLEGFFDVWVRKEAYVKYMGTGLSEGLSSFRVISDKKLSPVVIIDEKETCCLRRSEYYFGDCDIQEGIKAAFCSTGNKPIQCIRWINEIPDYFDTNERQDRQC